MKLLKTSINHSLHKPKPGRPGLLVMPALMRLRRTKHMTNTRELYQEAYRIARTSHFGLVIDHKAPDAIRNAYKSVGMREQLAFTGWKNESLHRRLMRRHFMRMMGAARVRHQNRLGR
jgi:alcohol dehydrogenase YqhD (iron-dependent ADH family)